ncbi:serine hydrolase domain-containing protein [Ligilactobacillus saerimneri]|uniref:serine hydrolase domain-containing protein n=1 Tax=Ligilactobacillus saerimneri TaxID=228229 RepID=UPI000422BCE8|nr:serine hydrolase domain-containing protein [Ligilactobacillus saerimneri]KRL73430.1 Beta-lactamase class C related penicillin binding protein [Ligilactobacillus saerimneri DSM 16049]MDY4003565.1 serine hydrolase domain-containing protein [Ligilactobacillus saerimneri]
MMTRKSWLEQGLILIVIFALGIILGRKVYISWHTTKTGPQQEKKVSLRKQTTQHDNVVAGTLPVNVYQNLQKEVVASAAPKTIAYVKRQLQGHDFTGTVTVISHGRLLYQQGIGYADRKNKIPNTATTAYQIASIQKGITAMLLMKQVQAGRVKLTDKISKYYPQIKYGNQVTLKDMVNMQSGVIASPLPKQEMNRKKFVQWVADNFKIDSQQIKKSSYQPSNYVLLAGIVERVSHQTYEHLFEQQIVKPLKLQHTFFYSQRDQYAGQYALGYYNQTRPDAPPVKEEERDFTNQFGTGNIYMTNGDLYRMLAAFVTSKLLPLEYTKQMYQLEGKVNTYAAGTYLVTRRMRNKLADPKYKGYYFRGTEFGYDSFGDISADGQTCVLFQANTRSYQQPFNMVTDVNIYKYLIDNKIQ